MLTQEKSERLIGTNKSPSEVKSYLENLIDHKITNFSSFQRALRHRSALDGKNYSDEDSYERLEFLGDAVLDLIVTEIIFDKFADKPEGFLTKLRAGLVKGETLSEFSQKIKLNEWMEVGERASEQSIRSSKSVLADLFEAIVGVTYQQLGYDTAYKFVEGVIEKYVDFESIVSTMDNYKSMLLEYMQSQRMPIPVYRVVDDYGPGHDKTFVVVVEIDDEEKGRGKGKNKKEAEQAAAKEALMKYDVQ